MTTVNEIYSIVIVRIILGIVVKSERNCKADYFILMMSHVCMGKNSYIPLG